MYERSETDSVSWYEPEAVVYFQLVDILGITTDAGVIDVGGGASVLVDALLQRSFTNLTVLDISDSVLQVSRERVGTDAPVTWIAHDLLTWEVKRSYDLWHDRAVFHFIFIIAGASHVDRLRTDSRIQAFFVGAGSAAIGAIAGSAIPLGLELAHQWQLGVLALSAIWLLALRRGVVMALIAAGGIGATATLVGAPS